jgi:mycofactocin precursor
VLRSAAENAVVEGEDRMQDPVTEPEPPAEEAEVPPPEDLVEDDLLVEDVSIDGMCGVY